jgi:UDPglucose 6-dehydrogenase
MIGIVGYGMVGKAVACGFGKTGKLISDPQYNDLSIGYMVSRNPQAIFVCVPTPTDNSNYKILREVLDTIKSNNYTGLVIVKSTVLPSVLSSYDVVYNPEFLSRATYEEDFVNPPFVLFGGTPDKVQQAIDLYKKYSTVNMSVVKTTDIETASLAKYAMNSFYALKVTHMNAIYDVANSIGADYAQLVDVLKMQPWMGTHHFNVPGPDGERGFGGPCLPKDTKALADAFDIELLKTVLEVNEQYRK